MTICQVSDQNPQHRRVAALWGWGGGVGLPASDAAVSRMVATTAHTQASAPQPQCYSLSHLLLTGPSGTPQKQPSEGFHKDTQEPIQQLTHRKGRGLSAPRWAGLPCRPGPQAPGGARRPRRNVLSSLGLRVGMQAGAWKPIQQLSTLPSKSRHFPCQACPIHRVVQVTRPLSF